MNARANPILDTTYARVRALRPDWISIEQSMLGHLDRLYIENVLEFDGGWIIVQQSSFTGPVEHIWSTNERCYLFDLALSHRPKTSVVSGVGTEELRENKSIGRVYMVPPGQKLTFTAAAGDTRAMRCFIDTTLIESYLPEKPVWNGDRYFEADSLAVNGGEVEWCLRRMYRELDQPDFASKRMIETLAHQLAVAVIRKFDLNKPPTQQMHAGGLSAWRLRLIRERAQADLPPPSLVELAALCDMTVRHLGRAFRAETGETIGKYLEAIMVQRANRMILSGVPVAEVARRLGYAKSQSFTSAFKRATGVVPSELKTRRPN